MPLRIWGYQYILTLLGTTNLHKVPKKMTYSPERPLEHLWQSKTWLKTYVITIGYGEGSPRASGPCPLCLLELFSMLPDILQLSGLCPISISGHCHHLTSHDPPFQLDWNTETRPSNPGLGTKICDREGAWLCGLYLALEDLLGPLPDPECPREAQSLLSPFHLGRKTPKSACSCVILFFHFTWSPQYQETEDFGSLFRCFQDSGFGKCLRGNPLGHTLLTSLPPGQRDCR